MRDRECAPGSVHECNVAEVMDKTLVDAVAEPLRSSSEAARVASQAAGGRYPRAECGLAVHVAYRQESSALGPLPTVASMRCWSLFANCCFSL